MGCDEARRELAEILLSAHAGELGAALAYGGHWRSLRKPDEVADVRRIELEERQHRSRVREMLDELGVVPCARRERLMFVIGTTISGLCRVGGWFVPMYGAGFLESGNIREYEEAARLAVIADLKQFVPDLLHMAEVEWDHERYFRSRVEGHWLSRLVPLWDAPPPRATIRDSFDAAGGVGLALNGAEPTS